MHWFVRKEQRVQIEGPIPFTASPSWRRLETEFTNQFRSLSSAADLKNPRDA